MTSPIDPFVIYTPPTAAAPLASVIDPALIREYRRTWFHVFADPPFVLRIGEHSPELAALYQQQGVSTALFITAYSPYSTAVSDAENESAQSQLAADLRLEACLVIEGDGQDPERKWPAERSLLAIGVKQERLAELGRRFRQNAVVCSGEDATPHLLLLR